MFVRVSPTMWAPYVTPEHEPTMAPPPGVYQPVTTPEGAHLLRIADRNRVPEEIFGTEYHRRVDRVINTYHDRCKDNFNTGVLMRGVQGSGKSMLANMLGNRIIDDGGITIRIDEAFDPNRLSSILNFLTMGNVMVSFDEFEKRFVSPQAQAEILTMLSGGIPKNILFGFTVNDSSSMLPMFFNRNDRIYYHYEFGGPSEEFITGYLNKYLDNKSYIGQFLFLTKKFPEFNNDMLRCVTAESNRYKESPLRAMLEMGLLNENRLKNTYGFHVVTKGTRDIVDHQFHRDPLFDSTYTMEEIAKLDSDYLTHRHRTDDDGEHAQLRIEFDDDLRTELPDGRLLYRQEDPCYDVAFDIDFSPAQIPTGDREFHSPGTMLAPGLPDFNFPMRRL